MSPIDIVFALASALILACTAVTKPDRARCPKGWALSEGIRRNGNFMCTPAPIGGDDDVLTGRQTSVQPPGKLFGKIYCPDSTEPIIRYDGRTVGCQRKRWQH